MTCCVEPPAVGNSAAIHVCAGHARGQKLFKANKDLAPVKQTGCCPNHTIVFCSTCIGCSLLGRFVHRSFDCGCKTRAQGGLEDTSARKGIFNTALHPSLEFSYPRHNHKRHTWQALPQSHCSLQAQGLESRHSGVSLLHTFHCGGFWVVSWYASAV